MATTLSGQVSALATQVGTDVATLVTRVGDLTALTTTKKASLVVALNELKAGLTTLEGELGAQINDSATAADTTWSSQKITAQISAAVTGLVNGAPETLDTLKELADALTTNADAIAALQSIAQGHVKYDGVQTLTAEQKTQARTNIDAASTSDVTAVSAKVGDLTSLDTTAKGSAVAAINEVKLAADNAAGAAAAADSKAVAAQTAVTTLTSNVGDTSADFVTVYTSSRGTI